MIQSENYIRPFEGNREADVAPGEDELDAPGLGQASPQERGKEDVVREGWARTMGLSLVHRTAPLGPLPSRRSHPLHPHCGFP